MPKRGSIARACEQRRVECRYDVEEGITRTAALKSKLEQLEVDYGSIVDLHSRLKHGQPDEVAALVNRIRAEDFPDERAPLEPGSITSGSHIDEPESSEDMASEDNWESFNTPPAAYGEISRNPFPPDPFYTGLTDNIPIDPALAGLDPQLNQYTQPTNFNQHMPIPISFNQDPGLNVFGLPISDSGAPVSTRQLFQTHTPGMLRSNLNNLRQGMSLQSKLMPEACSAYSESQVESLISDVESHADHEIAKARLCELSSIAAVSAQYLRGHLQPGIFEFFYDAAKHFFEDCMQSPLPHLAPLKVCAMLALANILSKSFLAFVYIDLGLSLARNLDGLTSATPQNLQRPDFMEAKRVRMTLLSLRGYAHEYGGLGVGGAEQQHQQQQHQ